MSLVTSLETPLLRVEARLHFSEYNPGQDPQPCLTCMKYENPQAPVFPSNPNEGRHIFSFSGLEINITDDMHRYSLGNLM